MPALPWAATGIIYFVWSMVAMTTRAIAIFVNSLWQRPALFLDTAGGVKS